MVLCYGGEHCVFGLNRHLQEIISHANGLFELTM
jgi:hypothetical protein